jgi:hypothetical protein
MRSLVYLGFAGTISKPASVNAARIAFAMQFDSSTPGGSRPASLALAAAHSRIAPDRIDVS